MLANTAVISTVAWSATVAGGVPRRQTVPTG
jgi:hypothetical protein